MLPWLYYAFQVYTTLQKVYATVCCLLAAGCIVFSLSARLSGPEYQVVRAGMFLCYGLTAVIPVIHWLVLVNSTGDHPGYQHNKWSPVAWLALSGSFYVCGALLYAFNWPEAYACESSKDFLDIYFNSHQLFHVLVVMGGLTYYYSLVLIMNFYKHDHV